jgi:DNA-binding response OmpR family regulator
MSAAPKTILIVDDSEILMELSRAALADRGFNVLCAPQFADVERLTQLARIDLILLDVQMPEAYGDDLATVLRLTLTSEPLIYLFSSLDESELAERAEDADCDGYIPKSAGIDAMVEQVVAILGAP